jgi:hypothetical protein
VLCHAGCIVTFEQTSIKIHYHNNLVIEGTQIPPGLWTTNITPPLQANASFLAPLKATALQHLHASLFSAATQTWTKAILNNHFATWPTFTVQEVQKFLPKSTATAMGHLDQQRKNLKSTRKKHKPKKVEDNKGINDSNPAQGSTINTGFANLIEQTDPAQKSYSDSTRRFPVHSSQGNFYTDCCISMMIMLYWLNQ